MPLTHAEILEIQAETFADDVPLHVGADGQVDMYSWSRDAVASYFESDGQELPGSGIGIIGGLTAASLSSQVPHHYRVQFQPRVAVRKTPAADGVLFGSLNHGIKFEGVIEGNWIRLTSEPAAKCVGGYVMVEHPQHGKLLELLPDPAAETGKTQSDAKDVQDGGQQGTSLKKTFELKASKKMCGANMAFIDASGASRDGLFDHYVVQELLPEFRKKFRLESIPDELYDTDRATDSECVVWCSMNCQIRPLPPPKGKTRKAAPGGVRQRVEWLGGLRCIVAEREEGSDDGAPALVVVLLHGINVLGDDLYGLCYHCATRPRVRFVLPAGPEESDDEPPEVRSRDPMPGGPRATSASHALFPRPTFAHTHLFRR